MLKLEKPALLAALAVVLDVVKGKNTIPILSNVLIERDGQEIAISGGNLSMDIRTRCAAELGSDFHDFTVPAHQFAQIVRNAAEDRILIDDAPESGQIVVRSGRSRLKLPTIATNAFPKLPLPTSPKTISLSSDVLDKAIKAVAFAADNDSTRPYLCGVYFYPCDDGLVLAATDGKKFSKRLIRSISLDDDVSGLPAIIIPNEAIGPIRKLLSTGEDVEIIHDAAKVMVEVGGTRLISKLVEGTFIDYERFQPPASSVTMTVSAAALTGAIARVLVATPKAEYGMNFAVTSDTLSLSARDIASGEGEDEIAVMASGSVTTGFNGAMLDECIDHVDGDEIEMIVSDGMAPAKIRTPGSLDDYMILMPTRTRVG
ncbi:DNA polymerase III subunit beta [Rhizobium sp. RU36D]|uniref:DNA polymerase III subunit beta n=1 Tax=Rhizobium sp. RU36D TaxID=1907415 RepID=UPI0009D8512C|nr:DNA polymerase III subunit beta [Rhizobium sp. RU36D]SMD18633.1 DNA polymerase III, beta subunit [Rhizobium sp. RU36D]